MVFRLLKTKKQKLDRINNEIKINSFGQHLQIMAAA